MRKYLDRHRSGRLYFRLRGKRTPLPGAEGSPEFEAEYARLVAEASKREAAPVAAREVKTASIEWFIEKYLASDFFVGRDGKQPKFSAGTRINYHFGLEDLRTKTVGNMRVPLGKALLADLSPDSVDVYLSAVARERTDTVARLHKILLSNLWKFARGFPEFKRGNKTNPLADAGERYTVEQEHEPWPDEVQERFLAACDDNLYLAFHPIVADRPAHRRCRQS